MNRFIIVDGLPYLYANGKAYAVRWDEKGFTVGAEVKITSVPVVTYPELSIKAKCAGRLDSIGGTVKEASDDEQPETPEAVEDMEPETQEQTTETPEAVEEPEAVEDMEFLEAMKLDALKEYASANNIALNGARTKSAIIAAIKTASAE